MFAVFRAPAFLLLFSILFLIPIASATKPDYLSFLGGSGFRDAARAVVIDAAGNAYVAGQTDSADFARTPGVFTTGAPRGIDAFVIKFDPQGRALWATTFGGSSDETDVTIGIDAAGDLYLSGITYSADFPTTQGSYKPAKLEYEGTMSFLTKLSNNGAVLYYSTYVNPANSVHLAVEKDGRAFLAGWGKPQADHDQVISTDPYYWDDHYVIGINPGGTARTYAALLDNARPRSIVVDQAGYLYVTGYNSGSMYTTPGHFGETQPEHSGFGATFVMKLDPRLRGAASVVYSGRLSGSGGADIVVDSAGNAYVASDGPDRNLYTSPRAFQTNHSQYSNSEIRSPDIYVFKVNPTGTGIMYATYMGSPYWEMVRSITLDANGQLLVSGSGPVALATTREGVFGKGQPPSGAWVARLNPYGTGLETSFVLGGTQFQEVWGIALAPAGHLWAVGLTTSSDFPTTSDAYQSQAGAPHEGWVGRFTLSPNCPSDLATPSVSICLPANGTTVRSPVRVVASAHDTEAVEFMKVEVDNIGFYDINAANLDADIPMSAGQHVIKVIARSRGERVYERSITINVQGEEGPCARPGSPGVNICTPQAGPVPPEVRVTAASRSDVAIARTEIWLDGAKIYEVRNDILDTTISLTPGSHQLTVVGADIAGKVHKRSLLVTVAGTGPCVMKDQSPSVTICEPKYSSYGSPVRVVAAARSDASPVTAIQIWVDYQLRHTVNSDRVDKAIDMAPGNRLLVVQGWNAAGQSFIDSRWVNVLPPDSPTGSCPQGADHSINVCSPAQGATMDSPVRILATSRSDEPSIDASQIYIDHKLVHTVDGGYLDYSATLAPGTHYIVMKAWTTGGEEFRAERTITVAGAAPTCSAAGAPEGTVVVCEPVAGSTVNSPVKVTAKVNSQHAVHHMKVYVDNQVAYSVNANQIDTAITMAAGQRYVVVQAWDASGRVMKTSMTIRVQ